MKGPTLERSRTRTSATGIADAKAAYDIINVTTGSKQAHAERGAFGWKAQRHAALSGGRRGVTVSVEHVQTKKEIQSLLDGIGIRPRKRFGQHFLIDGNLMRLLIASAELQPGDRVLEVGPGTGGLTDLLARSVAEVVCVEVDRDLQEILAQRFEMQKNVQLIRGDILENKHKLRHDVVTWLGPANAVPPRPIKLVANLPYQVATPLIMNLLIDHPQVRRMCFTVQAEVGDRFMAEPGTRDYGPISIVVHLLARARIVSRLPPAVFWPAPTVDSVMMCFDVVAQPLLGLDQRPAFAQFLRSVFDHRRKTLRAALSYAVSASARDQLCSTFDAARRPECVPPLEWLDMFTRIYPDMVRTAS